MQPRACVSGLDPVCSPELTCANGVVTDCSLRSCASGIDTDCSLLSGANGDVTDCILRKSSPSDLHGELSLAFAHTAMAWCCDLGSDHAVLVFQCLSSRGAPVFAVALLSALSSYNS